MATAQTTTKQARISLQAGVLINNNEKPRIEQEYLTVQGTSSSIFFIRVSHRLSVNCLVYSRALSSINVVGNHQPNISSILNC